MADNAPAPRFYDPTPLADPEVTFGLYRGTRLSKVKADYRTWLANPGLSKSGTPYNVPTAMQDAARAWIAADSAPYARFRLSGQVAPGDETTVYVVSGHGDADGATAHRTLDEALEAIRHGAPTHRPTAGICGHVPNPEDDRILVHEVLPSGHAKVVWHFSGWHWNQDEFGLPQGTLAGDDRSLHAIANDDGDGGW